MFQLCPRQRVLSQNKPRVLYTLGLMTLGVIVSMFSGNVAEADDTFSVVVMDPNTPPAQKISVQACAGLYNRHRGGSVYTQMGDKDLQWLEELNLLPDRFVSASDFLQECLVAFPQCVRYSYSNQQKLIPNILTVSAVLNAVPLDEHDEYSCNEIVFDATLEFESLDTPYLATKYVYENYVNDTTGLAMLNPGYDKNATAVWNPKLTEDMNPSMIDFVFSEKLFCIFLVNGCVATTRENELLERIAMVNPWPKPIGVYGYNNSWMVLGGYVFEAQTTCVQARNMGAIPTEVNNLSFFSSRRAPIKEIRQNELEDVEYNPSETYVAFVIGDGDNISFLLDARRRWLRERLDDCRKADNSCAPITWTISPHLPHIAPDVLEWYINGSYETGNDYFMLPPSGYLYAYPGSLAEPVQDSFVASTEAAAVLLDTNSTVSWEWWDSWVRAETSFLPKYAKKEGAIKGVFPVNVPYMFPTFTWKPNQFYKILKGQDGGETVLFAPRSWRGVDNSGNLATEKFYLSPDRMADEIGGYPRGTIAYVYMTSDGGLNLTNSFMALVKQLPKHVRLVSADTAARLALDAHRNTWGNPISFKTAHGKYLVAEGNGGGTVNADRQAIGPWEKFHLVSDGPIVDGAQISIQTGNGQFFSAQPQGGLDANRSAIGSWEKFTVINHSAKGGYVEHGHVISLKSAHGKYVVAEDTGKANANREAIGPWEKFVVIFH